MEFIKHTRSLTIDLSNMPGMIYQCMLKPDGQISFPFASQGTFDLLEVSPDAIMQDAATALQLIHPDYLKAFEHSVALSAQTLAPWLFEMPLLLPSGNIKWIKGHSKPVRLEDGSILWSGINTDITILKQTEDKLKVLFECATNALLVYDEAGIIDCNAATLKLMGFSCKKDLLGRHPASFSAEFKPADLLTQQHILDAVRKAAREKGVHTFEIKLRRANGEEFVAEVTINPVVVNHKSAFLCGVQDLTERKVAETRIKLTERRWMLTQQLTQSGSLEKDLIRQINVWSPEAFRIFGIPPSETGPSNEEILKCIHPEDLAMHQEALEKAKNKISSHYVLRLLTPQQEHKYIEVITKPVEDEQGQVVKIYGAILDITRQKNDEKTLLLKQEQLKKFIEYSPVALAMFDKNMNYIATSKVWLEINGLQDQEIIGKSYYVINPGLPERWKEAHQKGLAGEILKNDADLIVNQQGQQEWIRWEIWPWFEEEAVTGGIILYLEIITEQLKARQELIQAKEEAEQAAIAKSQFLSTMSHEIRTPMNAVIGLTHLMLQNDPRPDQVDNLKTLQFSAGNLLVLINDILDFNKIEAGKIIFEETDFSIEDLVRNIRHALVPQALDKGLKLKLMLDQEVPDVVVGDPVRLGQILTNLISNAIKFTPEGRVTVTVNLEQQDHQQVALYFQVKDTGIGIAAENITHIFESFTQATADITRKFGGTGLGLAITKRLLELQGSQIKVKSSPGKGASFYFILTFKKSNKSRLDQVNKPSALQSLKGTRVLMAEDYAINVLIVQQFLQKWEVELDVAENGLAALEMVQRKDYDLLLMDLQMPRMDGYQATAAIRRLGGKYEQLPIIALTASAMLDIEDKTFQVGMNDYISKPFDPQELYKKIARHAAVNRAV